MMAEKPNSSKYGPKVNTDGRKIRVIVSGRIKVTSTDPRVSIERKA